MKFGVLEILKLIGSLGFFIYGMKIMSEGIQKAAGTGLRKMLGTMTQNRFIGVFTGFLITAIIQSSSATTVMTVSFVNAGLLSLVQSAGIMLGANIGTTITSWLVAVLGFKVKIAAMALPLLAFGVPMLFSGKNKTKYLGEFIVGFAILFWGLSELKHSVPDIKNNPEILHFLGSYADMGLLSNLMFVLAGTLLTIIVQSSSASMALTQTLCFSGIIPFEVAAAMVLGENIGTTITAELASLPGNVYAKRSARIHSLFNIVGVSWMVLLISFTPVLHGVKWVAMELLGGADPYAAVGAPMGLAIFHTSFNTVNVLITIWFVPTLVKIATRTVKSKGDMDEEFSLEYISTGIMPTPELSMLEAKKEIAKFGDIVHRMNTFTKNLLIKEEKKKFPKLLARIKKYEEITDNIETEVAHYLTKVSEGELSEHSSIRMRGMLSIIGDLERMGDIFYQMSVIIDRKHNDKVKLTEIQEKGLSEMAALLDEAFVIMSKNLNADQSKVTKDEALEKEREINAKRNDLRRAHLKNIEKGEYDVFSGTVYSDLFSLYERIGDHIINVTEGIVGEV